MWEQSEVVLGQAASVLGAVCLQPLQARSMATGAGSMPPAQAEQLVGLLFDVQLARYTTAMKLKQQVWGPARPALFGQSVQQQEASAGVCLQRVVVCCPGQPTTSCFMRPAVCLHSLLPIPP